LRVFLIFALVAGGIYAVLDMALLAFLAAAPSSGATDFLRSLVSPGELAALGDKIWFSVRAVLEGSVGLAMLAGGVLIALRREWRGLGIAIAALIIDLTVVNLLVFVTTIVFWPAAARARRHYYITLPEGARVPKLARRRDDGLGQSLPDPLVSRSRDREEPLHLAYPLREPPKTHATDGDPILLGDQEQSMRAAVFALQRLELVVKSLKVQGEIERRLILLTQTPSFCPLIRRSRANYANHPYLVT